MSALRQSVKRPSFWIKLIAAVAFAAAAIFDWTQPASAQVSFQLYDRAIIRPYQRFVRPHTRGVIRCRYRPTCSEYSFQAVRDHGFPKGIWLTTKRILRCTPWVPAGTFDPIPPAPGINAGSSPEAKTDSAPHD